MSSIHVFDGGVVPGQGPVSEAEIHNLILRNITIMEDGRESNIDALFNFDRPVQSAPYFDNIDLHDLAVWITEGHVIQVFLDRNSGSKPDFAGFLQSAVFHGNPDRGLLVDELVIYTVKGLGNKQLQHRRWHFSVGTADNTRIEYLYNDNFEPYYNGVASVDSDDADANFLAYKITGQSPISIETLTDSNGKKRLVIKYTGGGQDGVTIHRVCWLHYTEDDVVVDKLGDVEDIDPDTGVARVIDRDKLIELIEGGEVLYLTTYQWPHTNTVFTDHWAIASRVDMWYSDGEIAGGFVEFTFYGANGSDPTLYEVYKAYFDSTTGSEVNVLCPTNSPSFTGYLAKRDEVVSYVRDQRSETSESEKETARNNIGVMSNSEVRALLDTRILENVPVGAISNLLNNGNSVFSSNGVISLCLSHSYMDFEVKKEVLDPDTSAVIQAATNFNMYFVNSNPNSDTRVRGLIFVLREVSGVPTLKLVAATGRMSPTGIGKKIYPITRIYDPNTDAELDNLTLKSGEDLYIGTFLKSSYMETLGRVISGISGVNDPKIMPWLDNADSNWSVDGSTNPKDIPLSSFSNVAGNTGSGVAVYCCFKNGV